MATVKSKKKFSPLLPPTYWESTGNFLHHSSFANKSKNRRNRKFPFSSASTSTSKSTFILEEQQQEQEQEQQAEINFLHHFVRTDHLHKIACLSHQACENFLPPTLSVTPSMRKLFTSNSICHTKHAKTFYLQLYLSHQACENFLPPTLSVTPSMRKLFTSNSICHTKHAKTFYLQLSLHLFAPTSLVKFLL